LSRSHWHLLWRLVLILIIQSIVNVGEPTLVIFVFLVLSLGFKLMVVIVCIYITFFLVTNQTANIDKQNNDRDKTWEIEPWHFNYNPVIASFVPQNPNYILIFSLTFHDFSKQKHLCVNENSKSIAWIQWEVNV
jgi:hypothetical protein